MIVDTIANAGFYADLHPGFRQAFDFLSRNDCAALEPGKYEIDGTRLFALVQHYETKPRESGVWEAHRLYFDVQFVAEGSELFGYLPRERGTEKEPYLEEADYALYTGEGDYLTLGPGMFVVAAPQDLHMPGISAGISGSVKKVVVKIRI